MKKILFVFCCCLLWSISNKCFGQTHRSDKITPSWVKSTPKNTSSSQRFIVVMDEGASLENIRKNRFVNLENYLEKEVQTQGSIRTKVTQDSNDSYLDFITSVKGGHYKHQQIDEYWEMITPTLYRHFYLYSISTIGTYNEDIDIRVTSSYGVSALARSIVPGWAQIYKGSPTKGYCIMGATVAGVAGVVVCENLRSSYIRKISEQPKNALYYSQQADNWENGRNIAIGATAAIYVYNIIDAIAAKGAKRVIVKNRNTSYSAVPTVMSNGSAGLMVSVNF